MTVMDTLKRQVTSATRPKLISMSSKTSLLSDDEDGVDLCPVQSEWMDPMCVTGLAPPRTDARHGFRATITGSQCGSQFVAASGSRPGSTRERAGGQSRAEPSEPSRCVAADSSTS